LIKGSGYEAHLIEDSLKHSCIPFIRRSSGSLLDNKHVSYIIDFLRLASVVAGTGKTEENSGDEEKNSDGQDDGKQFIDSGEDIRILNLVESVFLSDAIRLDPLFYSRLKYSYSKNINGMGSSFWDHICEYLKMSSRSGDTGENQLREKLAEVIDRIIYYSQRLDSNIHAFLLDFLNDRIVGLFKFLMENTADEPSGRSIWIGIGDFIKSVKEYVEKSPETDVRAYLEFIENLAGNKFLEEIEESTEEQSQPGMVNILSFHQCKGMEFDVVFMPFINNNYLPSKFKYPQVFDIQLFGTAAGKKYLTPEEIQKEHMAGEVRLFYNGLTRAKRFLYISSCRARGTSIFFERLREIKKSIIDNDSVSRGGDDGHSIFGSGGISTGLGIDKRWMLKKRSLVAMLRLEEGLKVDYGGFLKNLIDLNRSYPPENWWDIKEETASSNIPFDLFMRPFTYSGLDTYRDCPFKYKVRYYFSITGEESVSLRIGRAYHDILLKFFADKGGYGWDKLLRIIGQEFEKEYFEFPSLESEVISKITADLKRYHDNYLPPEPESTIMEKKFSFKLKKFRIEGRVDQINRLSGGRLELVDFKSGSAGYSKQDLKEEMQLKIYRLAIDEDKKLQSLQVDGGILMKYMCPGNEKKSEVYMPDDYYDRQEIGSLIEELAGRIIREDFGDYPKSFMSCKYCEYKLICPRFYGKED
jgi:CRISPR/Cas system-associated exonuclease Cas4 (RecB family)